MLAENFVKILNSDLYVGVPDSQLHALCDYLYGKYKTGENHIIAANEGNAVAIAAGHWLATGHPAVVYMQNSGIGNAVNPVTSLLNEKVYAIPCIFVIGWRGEPGIKDEPQHIFQGEKTLDMLKTLGIEYFVLDSESEEHFPEWFFEKKKLLENGSSIAIVVRRTGLSNPEKVEYGNANSDMMTREEIIEHIVCAAGDSVIVSTTGKASRELFEIRVRRNESHSKDFLTVGSMGHASSIALGIALEKKSRVFCIDGDGALLMHMGSLALPATLKVNNLVHIVINNACHDTVGGMPTVAGQIDLVAIAKACGYKNAVRVFDAESLDKALSSAAESEQLSFIEVLSKPGARGDLGRPTTSAKENRDSFKSYLNKID